jgi:hypothetical protein
MRLQQAPGNFPSLSPQLQEASHDDDDGNETSPTLTNNTPTAFQPETYTDEPSLEEAEATFRRFRDEMVVSNYLLVCLIISLNLSCPSPYVLTSTSRMSGTQQRCVNNTHFSG